MNKVFIFLTILSISLSLVSPCKDAKDFITGFFQIVKGKDWTLNENCFGSQIEAQVNEINEALKQYDVSKALTIFREIVVEVKQDCPIAEFKEIKDLIVSQIKSRELMPNIRNNMNQIIMIILETLHSQHSKGSFYYGQAFGSIANIVLYHRDHNLRFLADQ